MKKEKKDTKIDSDFMKKDTKIDSDFMKKDTKIDSDFSEKWGEELANKGFSQIPTYLLNINRFLDQENKLSPVELLVLIHLVANWWNVEEKPFPSIATIASRCGVSTRQVQRAINTLDEENFIKREKRKGGKSPSANVYDLRPLRKILREISVHFSNGYPKRVTNEDREAISEDIF
ncbi:helix-turn-helix domain-containing protein (plasmid) [Acetobacteraceae bacterium]|nr:helix-turn-helix domain-containing protein [Acetobacteraceae bacterium]